MPKSRSGSNIANIPPHLSTGRIISMKGNARGSKIDIETAKRIEAMLTGNTPKGIDLESTIENADIDSVIEKYLEGVNTKDRKAMAESLLKKAGLEHIPVKISRMNENGYCTFFVNKDTPLILTSYNLKSKDPRIHAYQIKTAFHELYHAKSDGLMHDAKTALTFTEWVFIDDVFAECSAHYLNQKAGLSHEIAPSYPEYLVNLLPRLKKLDEFKHCKSIIEFGREFSKFRFLKEHKTATWEKYYNHYKNQTMDMVAYAKSYESYVKRNIDEITEKIYEKQNTGGDSVKNTIKQSILRGWDEFKSQGRFKDPDSYSKQGFYDSLIIAMNRLGIN